MTTTDIEIQSLPMNDYLVQLEPDVIRVKGHRIGLEHIVERYQEGFSAEQIMLEFPGVELKAIYAIIAYYLHYQREVDAYIARVNARAEAAYQAWLAQPRSPASLRVQALKAQRERRS